MKKSIRLVIASIAMAIVVFASCKKFDQDNPVPANPEIQVSRQGEVTPDPPELKAKFKLEFSEKFLKEGKTIAFTKNGRKYYDGSHEALRLEFNSAARAADRGTKGNGWGQGGSQGGTTTGGGGTGTGGTTTGDITPPRVWINSPTAGQILDLNNGGLYGANWGCFVDDAVKLQRVLVKIKGEIILDTVGGLKSGYGNFNVLQGVYTFPFGDGTYDMAIQAWDSAGNTTTSIVLFSRNTQTAPITVNLPSSWILPTPRDPYSYQGGEGSCAAFAVANAYTIQRYVKEGQTKGFNSNNVYSPEWIYNIAVSSAGWSCGSGSSIISNMNIVLTRGIPTWNALPYDYNNGCDTSMFTNAIRVNAESNKIATWGSSVMTGDVDCVKQKIYEGKVGIFTLSMDRNFYGGAPDYIWTFPHYYDYFLHACVIVGYDDSKHAYLVFNSYGDSWAGNNCRWIDYDFFWQCVSYSAYYFNM